MNLSPFFLLSFFLSGAAACDRCVHRSKTSFFSSSYSLSAGSCSYGAMTAELTGGLAAAAISPVYLDGAGCGACFQIRCRNPKLCSGSGVKVVVTDLNKGNRSDFVLSASAFAGMARPGMAGDLKQLGMADVEYRRIPCEYPKKNLTVMVERSSRWPSSLAVKFLFQGGQTEITAVDVAPVGSPASWRYMSRSYGAVWSTARAPVGPLQFRFVVTGGYDGKWVWSQEEVLPEEWRAGEVYDAGVQITDIAQEGCYPCDTEEWR